MNPGRWSFQQDGGRYGEDVRRKREPSPTAQLLSCCTLGKFRWAPHSRKMLGLVRPLGGAMHQRWRQAVGSAGGGAGCSAIVQSSGWDAGCRYRCLAMPARVLQTRPGPSCRGGLLYADASMVRLGQPSGRGCAERTASRRPPTGICVAVAAAGEDVPQVFLRRLPRLKEDDKRERLDITVQAQGTKGIRRTEAGHEIRGEEAAHIVRDRAGQQRLQRGVMLRGDATLVEHRIGDEIVLPRAVARTSARVGSSVIGPLHHLPRTRGARAPAPWEHMLPQAGRSPS